MFRRVRAGIWLVALARRPARSAATVSTTAPRFYPDDPIAREPESQDASKAQPYEIEQMYEMVYNLFVAPGYKPSGTRAQNINTIDEVPDSSWFTNRIGAKTITADELARGPIVGAAPDPSRWTLIREKTSGAHPGFTARDAQGRDLVPGIRSPVLSGRRHGLGRGGVEDLLGARLQPGRVVPDHVRSEARRNRSEGDDPPAVRRPDRRFRRTTSTRFSNTWPATRTARIASSPAA